MSDELDKFVDESVLNWIKENEADLKPMYESYLADSENSECSFDEFAVYIFYEYNH